MATRTIAIRLQGEFSNYMNGLRQAGAQTSLFTRNATRQVEASARAQATAQRANARAVQQVTAAQRTLAAAVTRGNQAQIASARAALAAARAQQTNTQRASAAAQRAHQQALQQQRQLQIAAETTTQALAGIALAAGGGFLTSVAAAAKFEQSMSFVEAATHESASNMDLLKQAALDAGARTSFSATEAAAAVEELSKAGVTTAAVLGGGLQGALDLAAAGGLDVAEAAETAASAMTQFKLSGSQVPHIADLLAAGAGKAQGSVHDMGAALNQVGLVAAGTGLTIEETTGGLAAFASAGLVGSDAGTSFKTMLQALVPSSEEAGRLMAQLGISAYDSQGNFVGLAKYADILRNSLAGLTVEQQNAAMKTIFGSDAVRAANVLFQQGGAGIRKWTDAVNDQGFAAETAATRMDNLKGDLEGLRGSLETAFISTGDSGLAPLRALTQGVTELINAYNGMPASSKAATFATMTTVGAVGLLAGGFLVLAPRIVATRVALGVLSTQMPRTAAAMSAVGKAAGALVILGTVALAAGKLADSMDDTAPGLETMTNRLLALDDASGKGALGKQFEDLAKSIKKVTDPGAFDKGFDLGSLFGMDSAGVRQAKKDIDAIDASLAQLVSSGSAERAEERFQQLVEVFHLSGTQADALRRSMPQFGEALKGAANQSQLLADGQQDVAADTAGATGSMAEQIDIGQRLKTVLDRLNGAALSVAESELSWANGMADVEKAFKGSNDAIGLGTKLGREHRQVVIDRVKDAQEYAAAVEKETGSEEKARQAYAKRIGELRKKLITAGVDSKALDAFLKKIGRVPTSKETKLLLDPSQADSMLGTMRRKYEAFPESKRTRLMAEDRASGTIASVNSRLNSLPVRKTVDIQAVFHIPQIPAGIRAPGKADGGPVVGQGGPRQDNIPIYASSGEYVVNAKATRKHFALIEALNAGKFADGGVVGYARGGKVATPGAGILRGLDAAAAKGLAPNASAAAIAHAAAEVERLSKAWHDAIDAMDKASQRAELAGEVARAARAAAKAKPKDKADAVKELKEARKSLAEFDRQARIDAADKRNQQTADQLAAAQRIADNKAAYAFEHTGAAGQLKDLDTRLAKERRFSDTWMDLARQREQLAEQINETQKQAVEQSQQAYDEQLSKVNGYLDEQVRIQGQLADAQGALESATSAANAQLAEQTEQVKATRREALAGWFDITQKSHVSGGSSVNSLIKNAQGQIDQFREWMAKLADARGRGLSEGVISALGLDAGPESLGQLRKLSTATVGEIATLNDAVAQQNSLAGDQVAREQTGMLGELGRQLTAAQQESTDAIAAAQAQFLATQADLTAQMAAIGAVQGRGFADSVAQGLASGIPAVAQAARDLQAAYSNLSAAQAVPAIAVAVPAPAVKPAAKAKPKPKRKADGGLVSGPGGPRDDSIPAWLSDGEFVVNAKETARNRRLLEAVNAGRFAMGGYVAASRIPTTRSGGGPMSVNVDNVAVQYEVRRATEAITAQTEVIRRRGGDRPLTGASGGW